MSDPRIILLFKEHPTRTTTTPFSKVRKENLREVLEAHIRANRNDAKDRLPPRVFGGYHMTFERLSRRDLRDGPVETWLIHHSDGDPDPKGSLPGKKARKA
jgi:hypothetical protein